MKIYILEFLGHWIGGTIIVLASNSNEAKKIIEKKIFEEFGASKALDIANMIDREMKEFQIEKGGCVHFDNGEY